MREETRKEANKFCSEFGTSLIKAEARLDDINASEHKEYLSLVYFAAISYAQTGIKNILEIGTYTGKATMVLSKLFPRALVNTIDLPVTIIKKRIGPRIAERYLRARDSVGFKEIVSRKNIRFTDSDSFLLASLDLPSEFDLIYVDGSHIFPAIAWDVAYGYCHLAPKGFMFIHDCCIGNDVRKTVNHMREITDDVWLLPFNYKDMECKIAYVRKK